MGNSSGLVGCPKPHSGLTPAVQTKHREGFRDSRLDPSYVREHIESDLPHSTTGPEYGKVRVGNQLSAGGGKAYRGKAEKGAREGRGAVQQ